MESVGPTLELPPEATGREAGMPCTHLAAGEGAQDPCSSEEVCKLGHLSAAGVTTLSLSRGRPE